MNEQSLNMLQQNLDKLKSLFPELFVENQLDWEKLQATFGAATNFENERYTLNWAGKAAAFKSLQNPTTATLEPCEAESINFNSAEHRLIEGENLEVLKILQKAYHNKVKVICIDPPYNTGNDRFVYTDNFKGKYSGDFHSNWLNMMYPRLFMAKNLLTNDGLIFVHIDDHEVHNLRLLMNEIFGEKNFIGNFCWRKKAGAGADSKHFFRQHENILLFAKNINEIKTLYQPLTEKQKNIYKNLDNDWRGNWAPTDLKRVGDNDSKRIYEVTSPAGKTFKTCWSYSQENFKKLEADQLIWWGKNNKREPKKKRFLTTKEGLTPRSWIDEYLTAEGNKDLKKLNLTNVFDFPKPVELIKHFLQIGADKDSLILDFFAGSGTTAQAVLELNKEDGGNRKFLLVQLPEQCDKNSNAYKAGYPTIAAITKERIKRVINNLNQEQNASVGFKVFKLVR